MKEEVNEATNYLGLIMLASILFFVGIFPFWAYIVFGSALITNQMVFLRHERGGRYDFKGTGKAVPSGKEKPFVQKKV
jgi:hypothetical protein